MITKKGTVTSAKMTGTVTVTIHRHAVHPLYKKSFRLSKKFLVDTAGHEIGVGDEVLIAECRPLSKRKRFKIAEILKRAPRVSEMRDEQGVESVIHREKIQGTQITQKNESSASSDSSVSSPSA